MPSVSIKNVGRKILKKRGDAGLRKTATEIGISAATLSRIERGHLPDLTTFEKVCKWLGADPVEILDGGMHQSHKIPISVHFKKDATIEPKTAEALADMIMAAQRAMVATENEA